jgi:hypothetical protein
MKPLLTELRNGQWSFTPKLHAARRPAAGVFNYKNFRKESEVYTMRNITANWKRSRFVAMLFVALFGFAFVLPSQASESDKKTIVAFNMPVEIPGKVLPAGTYVFKRLDSASYHNIVQVYDKDERTLYAMLLTIPNYRPTPTDEPVLRLEERSSGTPEALKTWFYPGDQYGFEFLYPSQRAHETAKPAGRNALSVRNGERAKSAEDSAGKSVQEAGKPTEQR